MIHHHQLVFTNCCPQYRTLQVAFTHHHYLLFTLTFDNFVRSSTKQYSTIQSDVFSDDLNGYCACCPFFICLFGNIWLSKTETSTILSRDGIGKDSV